MKIIFLLVFSCLSLLAQAPVKFGTTLVQGSTTLYCSRLDLVTFGGVFILSKPSISCMIRSSNPSTTRFDVVITTQDKMGMVHSYSDHTAVNPSGGASPILFPTDDLVLLNVHVEESSLVAKNDFDGSSQEVDNVL